MSLADIKDVARAFAAAAERLLAAGGRIAEIHAAHGYLLHEFLSPLSNQRDDEYGGSFENRTRIVREVVEADPRRVAGTLASVGADFRDGLDRGRLDDRGLGRAGRQLEARGVDLVDCSSGRERVARDDPDRTRLPGAVRGAHPARHRA